MMKRFMSLLFSIVMAVGLCVPVSAEAGGGGLDGGGPYIGSGIGGLKDTGATTAEGRDGIVANPDQILEGDEAVSEPVQGHAGEYDPSNPDAYIPDGAVVPDQKATGAVNGDPEYATLLISQSFMTFLEGDDFTSVYQVSAYKDGSLAYSGTIGFNVASPDGQVARIERKIPAGSDVKVELAYAGPHYQLCGGHAGTLEFKDIPGGVETVASFGLVYNFENVYGDGAVNSFHVDADEGLRIPMGGTMPKTGGIGTLLIYAAGIAMAAASVHAYRRKRGRAVRAAVSLALAACMLPGLAVPAYAYFTDNDRASGGAPVALKCGTALVEEVSGFTKRVHVSASDDSCACWIRIKAWAPEGYSLSFDGSTGFRIDSEGWYRTLSPVDGGGSSAVLVIGIKTSSGEEIRAGQDDQDFNVLVVQESEPVYFDSDGTPMDPGDPGASPGSVYMSTERQGADRSNDVTTGSLDCALSRMIDGASTPVGQNTGSGGIPVFGNSGTSRLHPGTAYPMRLGVSTEQSEIDVYARVTVLRRFVDEAGEALGQLDPGLIQLHYASGHGYVEDGSVAAPDRSMFYHSYPIPAGSGLTESTILLEAMSVSDDVLLPVLSDSVVSVSGGTVRLFSDLRPDVAYVYLDVSVDAIQDHNAEDGILSAWGRAVTVDGDGKITLVG